MNKREAILDATLRLLAHKGFHGFSIKQVAEQAGVAAGTVYLYFHDRDDLIRQLHSDILARVAQYIFAEHDSKKTLFEQYRHLCLSFWYFCEEQPDMLLCKAQFDHLPPDVIRIQHTDAKATFFPLVTFFDQGRSSGIMNDLPDEILFSLGFEPYFDLARKHALELIRIDEALLDRVILLSWNAITVQQQPIDMKTAASH